MNYCQLAEELFQLIDKELQLTESQQQDVVESYPKLVICCEFFRLLRGEFFLTSRPIGIDCQKRLYQLEDQLQARVRELRNSLDVNDSRTAYYLAQGKKLFE